MPLEDYAIVVGISSYPFFGPGGMQLDLKSPVDEAMEVAAWLRDPDGGGLPFDNVDLVTHGTTAGVDPRPTRTMVDNAMIRLDNIARAQLEDNRGALIGRRLYIYMSGHGFSPARHKGCLFVADARERQSYNVHASAWLEWFQEAGYFREFVLWMDCCMDRFSFIAPGDPILPRTVGQAVPGPTFVGFAAQRPLKAAEVSDGDDENSKIRGAFTWALLDGLRGAAADANARVTGRSLADWLRQSILGRLPPAALADPDVSKEPEIVSEDAELIFARGVKPLPFKVKLTAPGVPDGGRIVIWSGAPLRPEIEAVLTHGVATFELAPGLYHAEAADTDIAASFEVVTNCDVTLRPGQTPVRERARDELFVLDFNPPTPSVEISVVDRRFTPVERSVGQISTRLPAGVFKLRTRSGRMIEDTVLLLDADRARLADEIGVSASATVAPVAAAAPEQTKAAEAFVKVAAEVRNDAPAAQSSSITLMARTAATLEGDVVATEPWRGLSVVDAGGAMVLALEEGEVHREDPKAPFAICTRAVAPGSYFLRLTLDDGKPVEQSLIVPEGWSLDAYVLRRIGADGKLDRRPRISVQMASNNKPCGEEVRNLVEMARTALGDERPILGGELEELLLRKFCNPMAGILGAHLLLLGQETGQIFDPTLLNDVVTRLRKLVGTEHPDVEALSLRCNDFSLRRRTRVRAVPMLARSWRLLAEASYSQPSLLSVESFRQLVAQTAFPPFLVWSTDPETRQSALATLIDATLSMRTRVETVRDHAAAVGTGPGDPGAQMNAILAEAVAAPVASHAPTSAKAPALDLASRADLRLARQRAAGLHLPAAAVRELFGALQDS